MTIRRMRTACRIPKATDTHSEYVILVAFPLQQWLYERTSMLRHSYSGWIVFTFLLYGFLIVCFPALLEAVKIRTLNARGWSGRPKRAACIDKNKVRWA